MLWWIRASIQEYVRSWSLVRLELQAQKLFFNLKIKNQIAPRTEVI